jgi:diguanylate cyclase (GGDEF)-like protein
MKAHALSVEHEQLACVGHLVLAQVLEAQGRHEAARLEHRALRQRERRLSSESLASRESLVAWQMGARQSARHLEQALLTSKRFEQWSFEDGLTGIANRRYFEQVLAQRIAPDGKPRGRLTLAMIDVDRFKSINDTFGHQAGDKVLKALAEILREAVRDNDLPARLAGDEFVVLFDDAGSEIGEEFAQRIRDALARFDWEAIAPGLAVAVSIGLANAACAATGRCTRSSPAGCRPVSDELETWYRVQARQGFRLTRSAPRSTGSPVPPPRPPQACRKPSHGGPPRCAR